MTFDAVIAVDWSATSGRTKPKENTIHAATATADGVGPARHFPTRYAVIEWLAAELSARAGRGERVLAVFDVAFGWPAGAGRRLTGTGDPLALWDWMAGRLTDGPDGVNDRYAVAEEINRTMPGDGPLWGRDRNHVHLGHISPTKPANPPFPQWRETERIMQRIGGLSGRPKSVWQLAYTGSVGSQTLTAMAALARLRHALGDRCAVWPFQSADAAPVVLAEVYLAHADGAEGLFRAEGEPKDAGQVRAMSAGLFGVLSEGAPLFHDPPPPREAIEEGWVLGIGHEGAIDAAARRAAVAKDGKGRARAVPPEGEDRSSHTPLRPPPLRNDCFALPPGVDWADMDGVLARLRGALASVTGIERLAARDAAGRVLAEEAVARRASPPAANAAVDGWGFACETVADPHGIPVAEGRAAAGVPIEGSVPSGHAIRVLTGAILPEGVDTVALQEDAATDGERVALSRLPKRGANTRRAGEDSEAGATVLPAGHRLAPQDLALLASVGLSEVAVRERLRVGVLSTGDELTSAGDAAPHQTFDANRPMLLALTRGWHHASVDLGQAPDDLDALRAALDAAVTCCDAILTSGGASAGAEDHLSAIMRAEGHVESWRIAIKPGRPLMLGTWKGVPVFGLPGNPVAAFVCALLFARPALAVLSGADWPETAGFDVPAAFAKSKKPGRAEFPRARIRDGRAELFASEGSGRVSGLSWAEGLVHLGPEAREIAPGDPVRFIPFAGLL